MIEIRPRAFTFDVVLSALMRRAVPEVCAGLADDPAEGGVEVAFFGAFPFDDNGAALGGVEGRFWMLDV